MDLLVIRHAIAADREEWAKTGRPDGERPLTEEGRARMEESARALQRLVPKLDLLATSPLARAVQTADVVRAAYDDLDVVDAPPLAHGGALDEVRAWLAARPESRIAIVGHEPDLGQLVSWFLLGDPGAGIGLKKGGACLLRFAGPPDPGTAELKWFLPPKVLRRLAT
jgi:phosphohistidine phosphatase